MGAAEEKGGENKGERLKERLSGHSRATSLLQVECRRQKESAAAEVPLQIPLAEQLLLAIWRN